MTSALRAVVVMDYQNVHLTGHGLFDRSGPRHDTLVDPLLFANRLIETRNQAQDPGRPTAALRQVLVFRGQPSSEHDPRGYARSLAQKAHWERDEKVRVTLRPLKYDYERDGDGAIVSDVQGRKLVKGSPREKGIDVLCALAVVREARDPATDLVILASTDSDLVPALDEALAAGKAKIETCCWHNVKRPKHLRGYELRTTNPARRQWNTRLPESVFDQVTDLTDYDQA